MIWKRSNTLLLGVYLIIAVISLLHYLTGTHAHQLHDVYRRLYYLPIILAAFLHGLRGGLITAGVVCVAYFPHAFGHFTIDPGSDTEKVLEMILYLAVGLTTGYLVSRLKGTQHQLHASIEQLRTTENQLVRSAKLAAVGRLSAGLAHEIRNPLAAIKGSAEMLADDFSPDHRKSRLLRILVDESVRLNDVLTRFLAFARPQRIEQQRFQLCSEIEAVVTLLRGQKEAHAVRLHLQASNSGTSQIRGDREQLRQVILNILLNACQAAGDGGEVLIDCETLRDVFRIRVRDSGPGFTSEALENAFTPFFTTKEQGTGLGLAISHRIVEAHGGQMRISNVKSGGGMVEVELPFQMTHV